MRAELMGCPIDILTMAETVDLARGAMHERVRVQHVALNVAKLVNLRSDPILAADVAGSDVVGIDGMGIVLGARMLGIEVPERVAGIDLFLNVIAVCAKEGFRPFLLGGTNSVIHAASAELYKMYPSLSLAGFRDGYFNTEQEAEVVNTIIRSRADCLFIGMPTPRKERFLAAHRDSLGVPFVMGVGGSFDIVAGYVSRAPKRVQALGLEWLYRVYQEPRRMWWRYAKTNTIFSSILLREIVKRKFSRLSHKHALSK
jgi:N-acetylglucosaminyldiphosphoundecaprenol N-acetyl-beta-D-mannosaminyltransferase